MTNEKSRANGDGAGRTVEPTSIAKPISTGLRPARRERAKDAARIARMRGLVEVKLLTADECRTEVGLISRWQRRLRIKPALCFTCNHQWYANDETLAAAFLVIREVMAPSQGLVAALCTTCIARADRNLKISEMVQCLFPHAMPMPTPPTTGRLQ